MQEEQSNLKTNFCKFCFKPLNQNSFTYLFRDDIHLCNKCYRAFNPWFKHFKTDDVPGYILYEYSETFASMLFQFKGCFDIELAPLFLERVLLRLKLLYPGYVLVPAPSTKESDEKRGFNHVQEIFKYLKKPIVPCIVKTKEVKQSSQGSKRKEIARYFDIVKGERLSGKKVLIVDDVRTSGSTLKAMIKLIRKHNPRKIKILVLSATKHDRLIN